MRLLAQHGYGDGEKINEGLEGRFIEGVIFRPRDITPERLAQRLAGIREDYPEAWLAFDPQLYAALVAGQPDVRVRNLEAYDQYYEPLTAGRLERESDIRVKLEQTFGFVRSLSVTHLIAPNIVIRRSLDTREALIAKNFIRATKEVFGADGSDRPVFATLAISRDALLNAQELEEFLAEITLLENPPDGFYLLVAANTGDARAELLHADLIASWMMINYSLKLAGFQVWNGYSDLFGPLLGAIGADAGATGWWSNARTFSLSQFVDTEGGRLPVQRYLSCRLLNRILFTELRQWKLLEPTVVNGLATDDIFLAEDNAEPQRAREVIQSWDALRSLSQSLSRDSIGSSLDGILEAIDAARSIYDSLERRGVRADAKSNSDHLEPLEEGIRLFRARAQV